MNMSILYSSVPIIINVAMATILTCSLILTVSNGIVRVLLVAPANAPQIKEHISFFPSRATYSNHRLMYDNKPRIIPYFCVIGYPASPQ